MVVKISGAIVNISEWDPKHQRVERERCRVYGPLEDIMWFTRTMTMGRSTTTLWSTPVSSRIRNAGAWKGSTNAKSDGGLLVVMKQISGTNSSASHCQVLIQNTFPTEDDVVRMCEDEHGGGIDNVFATKPSRYLVKTHEIDGPPSISPALPVGGFCGGL